MVRIKVARGGSASSSFDLVGGIAGTLGCGGDEESEETIIVVFLESGGVRTRCRRISRDMLDWSG